MARSDSAYQADGGHSISSPRRACRMSQPVSALFGGVVQGLAALRAKVLAMEGPIQQGTYMNPVASASKAAQTTLLRMLGIGLAVPLVGHGLEAADLAPLGEQDHQGDQDERHADHEVVDTSIAGKDAE